MPILTKLDIEKLSRRVLANYLRQLDRPPERIDPIDFSERMLGLRFKATDLLLGKNILGLTSLADIEITVPYDNGQTQVLVLDGKTAYIDRQLMDIGNRGRLNFTMMHEAAHHLLDMFFPEERHPILCRAAGSEMFDRIEWQANVMASCLLMPRELVRKTMHELGLGKMSRQVHKIYLASDYSKLSRMAEKLGVSKTALFIQLNQLGLMDRYFFTPHSDMEILPTKEEIAMEALWLE